MKELLQTLCLIATLVGLCFGQTVFREWKTDWYVRRALVIEPESFNREALEQVARSMIDLRRGPPFQQLEIFVDKRDAYPIPRSDHGSYDGWRHYYEYYRRRSRCVAEVVAFDDSVILRIRDSQGTVSRHTLEGTDPLMLSIGGTAVEIIHFDFNDEWRSRRPDRPIYVRAFGVTAAPLTPKLCDGALGALGKRLPAKSMYVYLRNDAWFDNMFFPIFYPFQADATPPSKLQWELTSTESCSTGTP